MKLSAFSFVTGVALSMAMPAVADTSPRPDEGLAKLGVALDKPSAERDAAERGLADATTDIRGKAGRKPEFVIGGASQGVLWGDLFRTGDCFALVELPPANVDEAGAGVVFAEWTGDRWQLRQMWKIGTVWRPEGWKANGDDYLPVTPATQPFLLEDFSGDGVPEVVIAGGAWKYFQENYLLRFLPETRELSLAAYAMAKPERVENYVRLYSDSGRRSIWSEWEFCKWVGDELRPVASWHSEVGYNENDPTFSEGMCLGEDGKPVTVRVLYGHGQEYRDDGFELVRNGQSFGKMRITWKDEKARVAANSDAVESAWLFEKITGLPRRFFVGGENAGPLPRLEEVASVAVEGNDEAKKLFLLDSSPATAREDVKSGSPLSAESR